MSKPIVVYREAVFGQSPVVEGKSPNKHNKFEILVEPLEESVYNAMKEGQLPSDVEIKRKKLDLAKKMAEHGMGYDEAKRVILVRNKNVLMDLTKGVQYMNEVMEHVKEAFKTLIDEGPLCREPCTGIKIKLLDASLHEDPVHRGPGQIIPAVRGAIRAAMIRADITLLEPKQIVRIDVPEELIGTATRGVENRRGQMLDIETEGGAAVIKAKIPVSDIFGFDAALKSATSGRGFYSMIEIVFERLPKDMRDKTIKQIRVRKGLSEQIPSAGANE